MHIVEEVKRRKPNAAIVVNAILPRSDINKPSWHKIENVNKGLKLSVEGMNDDNVYFFSAFDAFYDESTQNPKRRLHVGSTHLNAAGYQVWAKSIIEWTKENLNINLSAYN